MAIDWTGMKLDEFVYGYFYRNENYGPEEYILRLYRIEKLRDKAADRLKGASEVRKFEIKVRDLYEQSALMEPQ